LRQADIEEFLKVVIYDYIKSAYPDLKDKNLPDIYDYSSDESHQILEERGAGKSVIPGCYNIAKNRLLFVEYPYVWVIAHEVHHWAQAQRTGKDKYMEELDNPKMYEYYENQAWDVSERNEALVRRIWRKYSHA
jgi:hypothetical protein